MDSIFKAFPFPFHLPEAQELLLTLIKLNPTEERALQVVSLTKGLNTWDVGGAGKKPADVWWNILELAAEKGATRRLVQGVFDRTSEDNALRAFLGDLLENRTPVLSAEPRTPTGAPIFDDQIFDPETLLYKDDLMIPIGRVPQLIRILQRLVELAPAVCKFSIDVKGISQSGTGFRIGANWLLTNWHVVHSKTGTPATAITAEFGYEDNGLGVPLAPTMIPCELLLIASSEADDWAVVKTTQPLSDSIPILKLTDAPVPREEEMAYVIQHPNAGTKRLAYVRNQISKVTDRVVEYLADTQVGSSGAPVFNADGQLIGLHYAGGRAQQLAGKAPTSKNAGIRISRVVKGLTEKGISLDNI